MSGQRKKTLMSKGAWVEKELNALAARALEKKGIDFSFAVREMMLKLIDEQLTEEEQNEIKQKSKDIKQD